VRGTAGRAHPDLAAAERDRLGPLVTEPTTRPTTRTTAPPITELARRWMLGDRADPLHQDCAAPLRWTTVNLAEAFPGVPTPLTWTVVGPAFEAMARGGWVSIGALPRSAAGIPDQVEQRYITIFHGRPVFNLDGFRAIGDAMPGTSGDAVETQIFGAKRSAAVARPSWRRYPVVVARMPVAARRSRPEMVKLAADTDSWWRTSIDRRTDPGELVSLLFEAQRRILAIGPHHTVLSMLAFAAYEQVRLLAAGAGLAGLETELLGADGAAEAETVAELWALSRGLIGQPEFLRRHGFHGPAEGELATPSWRADPAPLHNLLASYRRRPDSATPEAARSARLAAREAARLRLSARLGPLGRARASLLDRMAHRYMPLRELGRCTFLKAIDVARYAANALGEQLAERGRLTRPDDVFYLCAHELEQLPDDLADLVEARRGRRAEYQKLKLPDIFTGAPTPTQPAAVAAGTAVRGLGVSGGVARGRVRLVLEPGVDELEPGEVLVCRTTDPGWASYFFLAAAVVIDVGGPISHGAIVARELGIPCVINTRTGTQQLRTGDLVQVDGALGTVEPL
jgi:pyruvate,water dikinase